MVDGLKFVTMLSQINEHGEVTQTKKVFKMLKDPLENVEELKAEIKGVSNKKTHTRIIFKLN